MIFDPFLFFFPLFNPSYYFSLYINVLLAAFPMEGFAPREVLKYPFLENKLKKFVKISIFSKPFLRSVCYNYENRKKGKHKRTNKTNLNP